MTFQATYETSAGIYHAYFDAERQTKARAFFMGWQKRINRDGFVFLLREMTQR